MMRYLRWFAPVAAMVLMVGSLSQTVQASKLFGTGTITVTVLDSSGNPVVGAVVTLHAVVPPGDVGTGSKKPYSTGKTKADGKVVFQKVAAGDFTVIAKGKTGDSGKGDANMVSESVPVDVTVTVKPGKS